ncbi:MAG: hypothetical protein ACSHX7_05395 [Luteolibacter sp.]
MRKNLIPIPFLFLLQGILGATLELGSPFSEHMVLQRGMSVPIWGKADPGAKITVTFSGQKETATAATSGKWNLELPPLAANATPGKFTVTSSSQDQPIKFSDVLVGEVWICSGQSNMQFAVGSVPEIKALTPSAKNIRTFEVPRTVALTEQETMGGQWQPEIPASAVAFGFAYFLEKAGNIPVGIIHTSWGSSGIEAWAPRDMTPVSLISKPSWRSSMRTKKPNRKSNPSSKTPNHGQDKTTYSCAASRTSFTML